MVLEVCCSSVDDALEAEAGGADRVELCSSLFFGGLTPSHGTIVEAVRRLRIPTIVMVRPRGGGFCYTDVEFAIRLHNFTEVISRTQCRHIHVAAFTTRVDDSTRHHPAVTFGGALYPPENRYDLTDRGVIQRLSTARADRR